MWIEIALLRVHRHLAVGIGLRIGLVVQDQPAARGRARCPRQAAGVHLERPAQRVRHHQVHRLHGGVVGIAQAGDVIERDLAVARRAQLAHIHADRTQRAGTGGQPALRVAKAQQLRGVDAVDTHLQIDIALGDIAERHQLDGQIRRHRRRAGQCEREAAGAAPASTDRAYCHGLPSLTPRAQAARDAISQSTRGVMVTGLPFTRARILIWPAASCLAGKRHCRSRRARAYPSRPSTFASGASAPDSNCSDATCA